MLFCGWQRLTSSLYLINFVHHRHGLPRWLSGKESTHSAGDAEDAVLIAESGRSPGQGNDNTLQYSKDSGAWRATVHGVTKSQKQLSDSVQFSHSVMSNSFDPIDCSMPGLPVHHQLLEFTQTHFHWVGDAIQPSHPLSSPSLPVLSLSQHQGLFKWVSSLHQVVKVLEFQLQHQSFQWIFRTDFL